ncbi:MAG: hypothetical protein V1914_02150 [archaeon]
MRKILLLLLILTILPSATALSLYYNITMNYDNGAVSLVSTSVVPLESYDSGYYQTPNDYIALITDGTSVLGIYHFDFNLWLNVFGMTNGQITNSQDVTRTQNAISIYLPYTEDATTISITDKRLNDLFAIKLKEPVVQEKTTVETPATKQGLPPNYILAALTVLLLIIILWLLLKKKKE